MTARIAPLLVSEAVEAGRLLAECYAEDPGCGAIWPDPAARARALTALFTGCARQAARDEGAVLARDTGGPVGVTLWLPPGTWPGSSGRRLRELSRTLPSSTRTALADPLAYPRWTRMARRMARAARPLAPYWYLRAMGVHPGRRGRGVGALIMAPVLARADEEDLDCLLHTSAPGSVGYWERFGFRVRPPELPVRPGGPEYLALVRPPGGNVGRVGVPSRP